MPKIMTDEAIAHERSEGVTRRRARRARTGITERRQPSQSSKMFKFGAVSVFRFLR